MFFEVSSLTYHIPITIDSLTYDACVGTVLRLSLCISIRLDRYSHCKEGPLVCSRSQPPPPPFREERAGQRPSTACVYNGLLNRCVLDEPVSGRSCQATMPPARCASVGVWGNCASVTPFAECESVCLVTVAADPTSSAGSVAALPLGRSDRR